MTSWQREQSQTDTWNLILDDGHGYVAQYGEHSGCAGEYNWQAARGDLRHSDIVADRDTAMRCAEAALAMPMDEFRQIVVEKLLSKYRSLEAEILSITPDLSLLPGYQAGFEAGEAAVKARISAAL